MIQNQTSPYFRFPEVGTVSRSGVCHLLEITKNCFYSGSLGSYCTNQDETVIHELKKNISLCHKGTFGVHWHARTLDKSYSQVMMD